MTNPKVTVIVPCRNEKAHIEAAVASMFSQEGVTEGFEIVIADGKSDDGTRKILDRMATEDPRLRVIENPGLIVSTGLNAAVRAARGEIIVRMDMHTEYAFDYIKCCLSVLEKSGAQNVGGPARTKANSFFQKANALAYHSCFSVGGASFHNPEYEGVVDTVAYGCWRKETLVDLGLFDEELVRNQDDELNLRIIRSGGIIWQSPSIRSWYYPRSSLSSLFKQYVQYGYWKVKVILKHRLPASIRHLAPGGFIAVLLALFFLSFAFSLPRYAVAVLLSLYIILNIGASLICCRQHENWKYLLVMPSVFSAYHIGYGWGFLKGIIDFIILRKSGSEAYSKITR